MSGEDNSRTGDLSNEAAPQSNCSTEVEVVSRRRLAFRPPPSRVVPVDTAANTPRAASSPIKPPPPQMEKKETVGEVEQDVSSELKEEEFIIVDGDDPPLSSFACDVAGGDTEQDTDAETSEDYNRFKKVANWSQHDIMTYYEAIKLYGKDFEAVRRHLLRKKVNKSQGQIKNFYFNSIKFVRSITELEAGGDPYEELCRDAKELFIVINACEWRRKTGNSKYQPERLKELIMEGSTSFRSKKKPVLIKTPYCPALAKFFKKNRRLEKERFPQSITLTIKPMTYADACFVVNCEQNPLLRINVSLNDHLSRIFQLLQTKWCKTVSSQNGHRGATVRLYPARETEVGKVVVEKAPIDPSIVSMNRLKEEVEELSEVRAEQQNVAKSTVVSYSAIVPNAFSINEKTVLGGLTIDNVENATVAEVFCLMGMTHEIALVYAVEYEQRRPEPWQILVSLLTRNYGTAIGREEEARKGAAECNLSVDSDSTSGIQDGYNAPAEPPAPLIESAIVAEENEAFEQQLMGLCMKRKKGKKDAEPFFRPVVSPSQRRITSFAVPTAEAAGSAAGTTEASGSGTTEAGGEKRKSARRALGDGKRSGKRKPPPVRRSEFLERRAYQERLLIEKCKREGSKVATDFSELSLSSTSPSPSCSILNSLRTPRKKSPAIAAMKGQRMTQANAKETDDGSRHRQMMNELFGGELSKSPSRCGAHSRQSDVAPPPRATAEVTENTTTKESLMYHLFGEVSMSPTKGASRQSTLTSESMQGMVNNTMHEMLGQNSLDFCKSFKPLVDTIEKSPQKKRRRVKK